MGEGLRKVRDLNKTARRLRGTNVGGSFEVAWRQIKGGITRAALSVMGE